MQSILVTGCAGFIGFHTAQSLCKLGFNVYGLDNINTYYSTQLKQARLHILGTHPNFRFFKNDLAQSTRVAEIVDEIKPTCIVHLAAQAGVRWSITNPWAYTESNITGFLSILEASRHSGVGHLIYASSSSVYGANTNLPFSVENSVDHPISLYAATKKANELMAHTYSHLYGLPTTGLRFFTVYGPWGRPDMAMWKFAEAIVSERPIDLYNFGNMRRDFTYVDDVVEAITRLTKIPPTANADWSGTRPDPGTSRAPYRVYNIGNNCPTELTYVVSLLERYLEKPAKRNLLPMQPGDVPVTFADVDALGAATGFKPATPIEVGVNRFIDWFKTHGARFSNSTLTKAAA